MKKKSYPGMKEYVLEGILKGTNVARLLTEVQKKFGYPGDRKTFGQYCRDTVRLARVKMDPRMDGLEDYKIERHGFFVQNGKTPRSVLKEDPPEKKSKIVHMDELSLGEQFLECVRNLKDVKILELCDEIGCGPRMIHEHVEFWRAKGVEIYLHDDRVVLSTKEPGKVEAPAQIGDREITFGVMSDLHFGSKECQITAMHEFCEIMRKRGIEHIFVPGDVFSGYKVYPGHEFDVYGLTADEQEESAIVNLPKGFQWYMLGGNHDYAFIKKGGGHNPLLVLASQREDVHYVGFDEATIPILHGIDMKLWHPSGGVPYSVSYRLQKGVEQLAYSELRKIVSGAKAQPTVRFILAGHLHIQMQAMLGSIFAMQCGCFEGQTNYLKRKGLVPNVGGYIVEASLNSVGLLKDFTAKFHMFDEIPNDYRNYTHSVSKLSVNQGAPVLS